MSTPVIEPGPSWFQGFRYGLYAKVVPDQWGDFKLFIQTFRTFKQKWKMAFFSKKPSTIELCFLFGRATYSDIDDINEILWVNILMMRPSLKARRRRSRRRRRRLRKGKCANDV